MSISGMADEIVRLRARITELEAAAQQERARPNARYTELQMQHARAQSNADGFQTGWHAALSRVQQGDRIEDLAELVPVFCQCSCQIDAHDFNCPVHNPVASHPPPTPEDR